MWSQFLLQNAHFALNLFAALVFFAVFWLYFDAWLEKKGLKDSIKIIGFLLLSISFVVHAAQIENSILSSTLGSNTQILGTLHLVLKVVSYVLIFIGIFQEKVQPRPIETAAVILPFQAFMSMNGILQVLSPILVLGITLLYLRKAYPGLEAHLKRVSLAFGLLFCHELFSLASLLRETTHIQLYKLVVPFGAFWLIEHLLLLITCVLLGRWVFGYLLKQFKPQLFFIINVMILMIFLITTVTFTGLLLKNIQDETLKQLSSDVKVLNFSIDGKTAESKSDAVLLASDTLLIEAFNNKDRNKMYEIAQQYLLTKKFSYLAIYDDRGQVVVRGEDKDKVGDSLAANQIVKRSLRGEAASSLESIEGALSPQIFVSGSAPIASSSGVIGGVILGTSIDNTFVDSIKNATSLETSIYGGNSLSATTLLSSDATTRLLGITEENAEVKKAVLEEGTEKSLGIVIANTPYFASYLPLKDIEGLPLGMISIAKTQDGVLQTAGRSIEFTFIVASVLLIFSIIPSFLIARYMTNQL